VPLYDPSFPTNHWRIRGGVDFDFPSNITLAAGATLLVVGFDPVLDPSSLAAFKSAYGIISPVTILGPWSGKLGNTNESVSLQRPDPVQLPPHPDAGFVPYVLVEKITYTNGAPWPVNVSATGNSLQRVSFTGYGNDATNWTGATPTPASSGSADTDNDGMADAWESMHGLIVGVNDSSGDPDHDGMTNLAEYLAGTDPQDPNSKLWLQITPPSPSSVAVQFTAISNLTYSVQYRTSLSTGSWLLLQNISLASTNRFIRLTNSSANPAGFYRVISP
jgi:hypothetical protein